MSRKDKLIKSKSIYSVRKKHQTLSTGTIYENDHVTILQNDGIFDDDIPMFSDSIFKYRIRRGTDSKKRHARYGWLTNYTSESNVWTLATMPEEKQTTEETKIVQKPNYSSLADFAYYGSAVELIKATVNDVIMRYPGGISYYRRNEAPVVWVEGQKYYLISNEFNIDFWTPKGVSSDSLENPMRVLGASYMNYEDKDGNDINLTICITGNCLDSIIGKVSFSNYYGSGEDDGNANPILGARSSDSEGDESGTDGGKELTVNAYKLYPNLHSVPIKNHPVTFKAYVSKSCTIYEKTVNTDENGNANVVVGEGQGWVNVSNGEDRIIYADYWNARIETDDGIAEGRNARDMIQCDDGNENENGVKVSKISSNSDFLEVRKSCRSLTVSAYTVADGTEGRVPLGGEVVHFYAYNEKGRAIFLNSAITNRSGIAKIELCEGYGWIRVSGTTESVEDSTHWSAAMRYNGNYESGTTMGGRNFLGEPANDITNGNDYEDIIIFKETTQPEPPTPEPACLIATAYTRYPSGNFVPMANATLFFRVYISKSCTIYEIEKTTDENGVASACTNENGWQRITESEDGISYADYWNVRLVSGATVIQGMDASETINCDGEDINVSFIERNEDIILLEKTECERLKVSAYTVTVGSEERNPIVGGTVDFYAYCEKGGGTYWSSGTTDEYGYAEKGLCEWKEWRLVDGNDSGIENATQWVPMMTMVVDGVERTESGNTNDIVKGEYEDIIEFMVETPVPPTPDPEPEPICFTATAYTQYPNGHEIPIANRTLYFRAYITKSCTIYEIGKTTNENGVATACLNENGWQRISESEDGISYADYWSVRLNYNDFNIVGENASESIYPCETVKVSSIDNREDVLHELETCKKLIVTAYTRTNGVLEPLAGRTVNFTAYNDKGPCTIYINSSNTDSDGVARIELCEGYGWTHVSGGTESIENTTHWVATMTYNGETLSGTTMGGTNCQGNPANDILVQNDYTDVIIFDEEPNFHRLNVHVQCNDKSPLEGVQVWIDLFFEGISVPVYRTYGTTNGGGDFYVTSNDSDWYVYNGLWHANGHPWQATSWTAYCQYGGEVFQLPENGEAQSITDTVITFTLECKPEYPFDSVKVYTYAGAPGNCSIITGAEAHIFLSISGDTQEQEFSGYTNSGYTQEFSGYTNNLGYYHVDFDDCTLDGVLSCWTCYAKYEGTVVSGVTMSIQGNNDYQNLYFKNMNPQTGFDLIVTAYTNTNNIDTPHSGGLVTFYVISNKDVVCAKTDYTNGYGVAAVNLSDPGWDIPEGSNNTVLLDACCWYAVMPYGSEVYSGISATQSTSHCGGFDGGGFDKTANPIDTVREDIIRINLESEWLPWCSNHEFKVCVRGIDTIPDSNCGDDINEGVGLSNVPISISGYTGDYGNVFWIAGRTDSGGCFTIGDVPLLWTKIAGNGNQTIYDINYFSACCYYNSEFITCGVSSKSCEMIFRVRKKLEPMPYDPDICDYDDCNYKWFDIYLDPEGNKKLVYQGGIPPYPDNLVIIRPKKQFRIGFWENLDDFEKVLFDRQTTPVYKAEFETPYLLDDTYYYNLKQYVWPTVDGEMPDLSTLRFQGYLKSLIGLAEYHDEFDSDNLWRMMTHESIKNLDWTFMRTRDDEYDDGALDSSRMRGVLSVWGRHFDDIKRYADNIKASNSITYDEKNNLPDYFLTDSVEIGGFEAKSVTAFSALTSDATIPTGRTDTPQQSSSAIGKTMAQVNSDFMRRLAINEVYIQSMKGTRRGIEAILGLFGYVENHDEANPFTNVAGEYDIHEYISVARKFPSYAETSRLRALGEYVNYDENTNFMDGYPVAVVSPRGDSSEESDYYLIPWFNSRETYKYPFYFQQKGGWGRMLRKSISEPISIASSITESYGMAIYKETEPYMKFVRDIDELKQIPNDIVFENMVCYVTDISDIYNEYNEEPTNPDPIPSGEGRGSSQDPTLTIDTQADPQNDYSHYFVLKNISLSNYVGFVSSEKYYCYGWKNVKTREYKGATPTTDDGFRVLYLESIFQNNKDNNPHAGYGMYDDGDSYLNRFERLFGEDLDNRVFDFLLDGDEEDRNDYDKIAETGFDLDYMVENNKKCYFFDDTDSTIEMRTNTNIPNHDVNVGPNNWTEDLYSLIPVGEEDTYDYSDYDDFVNPEENGEKTDEAAANSIINVKNLVINFGTSGNRHLKKYIESVVMPYLEHMIPSTTILKYRFDNEVGGIGVGNTAQGTISSENIVADGVTTDEGSIYLIENNEGII